MARWFNRAKPAKAETAPAPEPQERHPLVYELYANLFQHYTNVALIGIGGVITAAASIFAEAPDKWVLWLSAGGLFFAGLVALSGQSAAISSLERGGAQFWLVRLCLVLSTVFIALSAGVLFGFSIDMLS